MKRIVIISLLLCAGNSVAQVAGQGLPPSPGGGVMTGSGIITGSNVIDAGVTINLLPPPTGFAGLHVTLTGNANPPIQNTWLRISLADGVSWAQMASGQTVGSYTSCPPAAPTNPTDPCYNWTKFDTWTAFAKQAGYGVILNIQNTPRYIAANNADATCSVPGGFVTPAGTCTPPTDVNCDGTGTDLTLINFAKALMAHMNSTWQGTHQVPSYYEGWQEPDINSNWDNTYINSTLCGSTANASQKIMKRMMSDLATTIKSLSTGSLVTTPSPSNGVTAYAAGGWGDTYLAQGGGAFADLLTTHGYSNAGSVCSGGGGSPSGPTSQHIWVITMENTSAASTDPGATSSTNGSYRRYVYNNTIDMPYFNNTLVPLGTKLTQIYSDTHSSWPAWVYFVTGNFPCGPTNKAGDCTTSPALGACSNSSCLRNEQCWNANNLGRQARLTVGSYDTWSEGMCFSGNQADNTTGAPTTVSKNCAGYKRGHNPLPNFSDMSQGAASGPSTADPPASFGCATSSHFLENKTTATSTDAAGSEAQLIASINTNPTGLHYVTPSLGSDMHGTCSTCSYNLGNGDGSLVAADNWMKLVVGALLKTPAFQPGGDGLLLIMWDEGNIINGGNPLGTATDDLCTATTHGCGGHVPALIIGPNVQTGISLSSNYLLANLERLICDSMGTASCPGAGATAAQIPAYVAATGCPRPEGVSTMASVMDTAITRNSVPTIKVADTESSWGAASNITDANYQEAYAARHALLQAFQGFLFDVWMAYDAPQSLTTPVGTTLNATGTAWGQATSWLTGMTLSGPCACTGTSCSATPPVGTFKCEMTGPNNYTAEVVWDSTAMPPLSCNNPQCGNVSYTAPVGTDQWRDLAGVTHIGSPTTIGSYPIIVENNIATNNNGSCSVPTIPFTAANFSIGYNKPGPAGQDLLGGSTERLFNIFPDTDFPSWANMQSSATTFNYAPLDFWVSFSTTNNKQLLEHVSRVPTFISSNSTDTTCSPTGTCYAPTDLASGDTTFKDFVSRVVSRDGCTTTNTVGCVKYWGFINEPNSQAYWRTGSAPADSGTTYANYVQMFKDFASAVHGINANLCVMSGDPQGTSTSSTSGSAGWFTKVLPQLAGNDSQGHPYIDIIGFHPYLNTTGGVVNSPSDPAHGQDVNIQWVKQAMGTAGMAALPIWATEYFALGTMPDTTGNNTDQYLTQDQYIMYESGVVNTFWYEPDIQPLTVGQSLYTDTTFSTLNSAGLAWKQVKANLIGTQPINSLCTRVTSTEITCPFKNAQTGVQYLAAWDVSAAPSTVSCAQYVQYTQMDGTVKACPFGGNVVLSNSPIWLQSGTQNAPAGGNAGRANDWPY